MSRRRLPDGDTAGFLEGRPSSVERVRSAVDRIVRSFQTLNAETHRELAQEVMARVYISLRAGRFRGDSTLTTYAQNVAKYTCIEHLRRRRLELGRDLDALPSAAAWSAPEDSLIQSEEHQGHLRAFAELPVECRDLLRLIFLERLSYREVAERLGVSEGAIKSRVHRCRLTCRAAMESMKRAGGTLRGRMRE